MRTSATTQTTQGLGLAMPRRFGKIEKLPSGNFRASFMAPDRSRMFAPVTFSSEADAETWLSAQRTDVVRGTWRGEERGRRLFRDYAWGWLRERTDLKPRTTALYSGLLERHIEPEFGDLRLRDITPAEVRHWYGELAGSTGPTARAQSYRLLHGILGQAVRDTELEVNPCQIRKGGTVSNPERQAPSLAQVHALADSVPKRYRAMVLVAAYGGLRLGELTALSRADLTIPESELPRVRVRRAMHRLKGRWLTGTPKSAAGARSVALPEFLGPVLADHLAAFVPDRPDALVFGTKSGRPLSGANFGKTWRRVRETKGQPDVHFHDLRHAAATLAVQSGATLKDTMARLGHSTPRAALIYQHTAADRDEAIAQALGAAYETQVVTRSKRGTRGEVSPD